MSNAPPVVPAYPPLGQLGTGISFPPSAPLRSQGGAYAPGRFGSNAFGGPYECLWRCGSPAFAERACAA
eukprot:1840456-Pyramimonas_sp.AAC.1